MVPFWREESQFGSHRVLVPDHPRIVNLEPTSRSSLQAVGGSIGKYSDREDWTSAARSAPPHLAGYPIADRALSALNGGHKDGNRGAEGWRQPSGTRGSTASVFQASMKSLLPDR